MAHIDIGRWSLQQKKIKKKKHKTTTTNKIQLEKDYIVCTVIASGTWIHNHREFELWDSLGVFLATQNGHR